MITWGFPPSYSDVVVNDQYFTITDTNLTKLTAAYISVTGLSGDIVWENNKGEPQWYPGALQGQNYILGATRILSAATVRGTARSTTATGLVWTAVNTTYDAP
jgi:hypothetical protein